jgi:hypothetical protein
MLVNRISRSAETGFKRKTGLKNASIPYNDHVVPLGFFLPLALVVLPGPFGGD